MKYIVQGGTIRLDGKRYAEGELVEITDIGQAKPLLDLGRVERLDGHNLAQAEAAAELTDVLRYGGDGPVIASASEQEIYDQAQAHSDLLTEIAETLAKVEGMPPYLDLLSQVVWLVADHHVARGDLAFNAAMAKEAADDAPPPPAPEPEPEPEPAPEPEPEPAPGTAPAKKRGK